MSNQGFTFPPPPPPPPPKKDVMPGADFGGHSRGNRGGSFSRGTDRGGGFRGRSRCSGGAAPQGNSFSGPHGGDRGDSPNGPAQPSNDFIGHREWSQGYSNRGGLANVTHSNYGGQQGHFQPGHRPTRSNGMNHWNPPQKRDYNTAFNHRGRGGSKPAPAPAVPSFLSNIPGLSPEASTILPAAPKSPVEKKVKLRTSNILGLNPSAQGAESDDDDEDEEAKLATTTAVGQNGVAFEYGGRTATLKTPAEIAAWIADRKKRYPTAAKAEQAKKDVQAKAEQMKNDFQERQRKWEEEKKANNEARRLQRGAYEREKAAKIQEAIRAQKVVGWLNTTNAVKLPSEVKPLDEEDGRDKASDVAEKARLKTEKLMKKAAKAQKQLAKAQKALMKAQGAAAPVAVTSTEMIAEGRNDAGVPDVFDEVTSKLDGSNASSILSDADSDDEATSSSGSSLKESDSDSESAPEVLTTKRTAPDCVPPQPRAVPPPSSLNPEPCRNMIKFGKCKAGRKCRYSHDPKLALKQTGDKVQVSQVTGRPRIKGLYEVMVEKEKEEELRRVLRAVVEMGERGLLEEDNDAKEK